jgi:N utilization substance protein A
MLLLDNKKELLSWIETVSNVEDLEQDAVKLALEEALATGIRKDFSKDTELVVKINELGESLLYRKWIVVDDNFLDFSNDLHIYEDIAQENFSNELKIGDVHLEVLEDYNFKRINALIVKQLLKSRLKEAHNKKLKDSIKNKEGQLLLVNVKKYDRNGYTVEYNNEVTGFLPFDNLFSKGEKLRVGNSYFVVLDDLEKSFKNYSVIFTRKSEEFIRNVFAREVPEIADELIEIKSVAKYDNKILVAVHSGDKKIDVIGSCVGSRGIRIQGISKHFNGEKIEILRWSPDFVEMINEVIEFEFIKLVVEEQKITMIVEDNILNVINVKSLKKVLSTLVLFEVDILGETEFNEKESNENSLHLKHLMLKMNLDEDSAGYLIELGLFSIDDIFATSVEELIELDLTEEDSSSIKSVATEAIHSRSDFIKSKNTNLIELDNVNDYMADTLLINNISNQDELAELSTFELTDILPIDQDFASKVIMESRESAWF